MGDEGSKCNWKEKLDRSRDSASAVEPPTLSQLFDPMVARRNLLRPEIDSVIQVEKAYHLDFSGRAETFWRGKLMGVRLPIRNLEITVQPKTCIRMVSASACSQVALDM